MNNGWQNEWLEETLGPLGLNLTNAFSRLVEKKLAPFEIIPIYWAILVRCYTGQADTVTGLARLIPIDIATISRHVASLGKKGMIRRRRLRSDRRVVKLELTEAGLALMPHIVQVLQEVNGILYSGVSEEDKRVFLSTVSKILANSEKHQSMENGNV
jgi:DNA-binding MarR family transcriptional regulator